MERRVQSLLDKVPGYRGYRAKEDRRDADKRVREHLATAFGQQADRIERVARDLATQRRLGEIGPVDEFARTLRHLIDRIRTATYGYGGLFSDRDVNAAALDQLRQFDESLLSGVEELNTPIRELEAAHAADGDRATAARTGTAAVRTLLARLDLRGEVIETAQPAPEPSVLDLLQPIAEPAPHPAYDLHERDAVSILDDNFIVDARVDIKAGDQSFRLFRLGSGRSGSAQWLYAPQTPGMPLGLLGETSDPWSEGPPITIGAEQFTRAALGTGEGELIGTGGASGARQVSFSMLTGATDADLRAVVIDWGNERQVLVGKEVHPGDVEVFGRSRR